MRRATLISNPSIEDGTFGVLLLDDNTYFATGELPWHNNDRGTSCIPEGTYKCTLFNSPKHGWSYLVNDVPGRSFIEVHPANFMADKSATSKHSQLLGCIALGKSIGQLEGQTAILQSKIAVQEFENNLNGKDLELTIIRIK